MKAVDSERTYIDHHGEEKVTSELSIFEDDGSRLGENSKKALLQAVLGAVESEEVSDQEGQKLAMRIINDTHSPTVYLFDKEREDFIGISLDNGLEHFARKRREAIFSEAAIARVGVSVLYDELSVRAVSIEWFDKNGVSSDNINGDITPMMYELSDVAAEISGMCGGDSNEAKLAIRNSEFINGYCYVVNPAKVQDQYLQLTNLEGEGIHTPFMTILSEDYHDRNIDALNKEPSIAEN